jgi:hypothetical protein
LFGLFFFFSHENIRNFMRYRIQAGVTLLKSCLTGGMVQVVGHLSASARS